MTDSEERKSSFPFLKRNVDNLVASVNSPSEGTMRVTASHVKFFRQYLEDIAGKTPDEAAKWHQMTETQLVFHMKEFFSGIKKRSDGSDLQPSYFWNIFSSLKRQLKLENGRGWLSQTSVLEVADVLKAVCKELRSKGEGNKPYAKDKLTQEEIGSLFDEKVAGPHNPRALINAMAVVLMFMGVRGNSELYNVCLGDLTQRTIDGVRYLVLDKEGITKTREGWDARNMRNLPKLPELPEQPDRCPVRLFRQMIEKRPKLFNHDTSKLFVRPATTDPKPIWPTTSKWFLNQAVGIREVAQIGKKMVSLSSIDISGRKISNTSFRKFLRSTMLLNGVSTNAMMNQMGLPAHPASSIAQDDCTPSDSATEVMTLPCLGLRLV